MRIFLDKTKIFDTVYHGRLILKLENVGIRHPTLNPLGSYLCVRNQRISTFNVVSKYKNIKCDVSQGTVLGPILFLTYADDLINIAKYSTNICHADDAIVLLSVRKWVDWNKNG